VDGTDRLILSILKSLNPDRFWIFDRKVSYTEIAL
jgi:hypothetical protein